VISSHKKTNKWLLLPNLAPMGAMVRVLCNHVAPVHSTNMAIHRVRLARPTASVKLLMSSTQASGAPMIASASARAIIDFTKNPVIQDVLQESVELARPAVCLALAS
jgi:hypothetical protein